MTSQISKRPTIAVIGGAGFIGAHTCKALYDQGFNPVVIDNFSTGHKEFVQWGDFFECSLINKQQLKMILDKLKPLAIIHFAALIEVGESVTYPERYYENNVLGTFNLLSIMRELQCSNIIFSSTAAVYGNPQQDLISEDHSVQPINPYGHSKHMVETIIKDFHHAYGLNYIIFRYFNACGADKDITIGEDHSPESHLIPNIYLAASGKRSSLQIFGDDYNTKDGSCIRDYVHVSDLADAHVKGCFHLLDKGAVKTLNLGTSKGYSVKEVFRQAETIIGKAIPVSIAPRRQGDSAILVANAKQASQVLDWAPQHSSLENIIQTSWKWFQRRFDV